MRNILKKLALLFVPVAAYFCFFCYFEPNNYFGLKTAPAGTFMATVWPFTVAAFPPSADHGTYTYAFSLSSATG